MLTRRYITDQIAQYRQAEQQYMAMANANHGAVEALELLLAEYDRPAVEIADVLPDGVTLAEPT